MRRMAEAAERAGQPLPALCFRNLRWRTALGVPAFVALVVFWLMVAKPV